MKHNFSMKKILNLCLRWHILRSYQFVAEVTFKLNSIRFLVASVKDCAVRSTSTEMSSSFHGSYSRSFLDNWLNTNQCRRTSQGFKIKLVHILSYYGCMCHKKTHISFREI